MANLIYPNDGMIVLLNYCTLRTSFSAPSLFLYKNNLAPTRSNVLADFTPCDYGGYADVLLSSGFTPPAQVSSIWQSQAPPALFFSTSSLNMPQTAFGYGLKVGGKIICAQKFVTSFPWSAPGQVLIIDHVERQLAEFSSSTGSGSCWTDLGNQFFLKKITNQGVTDTGWIIRLFQNNFFPSTTNVFGDFTECDFSGYSSVTCPSYLAPFVVSFTTLVSLAPYCLFTAGPAIASPQTAYGYYACGNNTGEVHYAERFASPFTFNAPGDFLPLIPAMSQLSQQAT